MKRPVFVAGVGMTKFSKPGMGDRDYPEMVHEAGGAALADAGIGYEQVEQIAAGLRLRRLVLGTAGRDASSA